MVVAKNNEPFRKCDGFLNMVSEMSLDVELAKEYWKAGKKKTTQIVQVRKSSFQF